jgi:hypothetical protein
LIIMMRRRFTLGLLALAGVLSTAAACASLSDESGADGGVCVGPSCEPVDAPVDVPPFDTSIVDVTDAGAPKVNPLCGTDHDPCVADYGQPNSCSDAGTDAPAGVEAGSPDASGDGSSPFSPPETGLDAGPGPASSYEFGCYVTSQNGTPVSECLPAGNGVTGAPCTSSKDCAAGFACIGEKTEGQCRPFCCADPEACPPDTFCDVRPLRDTEGTLSVPVCAQADNCNLAEQYPCPSGATCACPADKACMVVRADTTSCVTPGTGKVGDPCPCAWGHVCSMATHECLKLCQTTSSMPDCGSQKCTPVSYLPDGWGVCAQGSL